MFKTFGSTIPQPKISTQPVYLHILQPFPPHIEHDISISADGSVKGKYDGRSLILVFKPKISFAKIREALDKGNVKLANRLLGYKYSLYGKVIKGNKIGRKIGFPTANIDIENDFKLIPAIGVYAVLVIFNNKTYKGMLNIGIRPTLNINKLSIEVNIFDFDEVIYNKYLTVIFKDRIRDEIRFKNLEELIIQLKNDKINAEKILN